MTSHACGCGFEQGPIRPPSEAGSLLVRVTRNCPWNRCAFCPVYKELTYGTRGLEEILADLDAMKEAVDRVVALSWKLGRAGRVDNVVIQHVHRSPDAERLLPVAWWLFNGGRTVFLQDANALASPHEKLLGVLQGIRERFEWVDRITTYSQSRTLARRPAERLAAYREAGLSRVHVGLESGSDRVLELMDKGASAADHVEAGRRVLEAGLHLCCYVMPGLGGLDLRDEHVRDTARVLEAIQPSAVRLRSLVVSPRTPLARLMRDGGFRPLSEADTVAEIRALLAAMTRVETTLVSDHDLNLLPELEGRLPGDLPALLDACDRFLSLSARDQRRFILGRRTRRVMRVADLENDGVRHDIDALANRLGVDLMQPVDPRTDSLRRRLI